MPAELGTSSKVCQRRVAPISSNQPARAGWADAKKAPPNQTEKENAERTTRRMSGLASRDANRLASVSRAPCFFGLGTSACSAESTAHRDLGREAEHAVGVRTDFAE